MATVKFYSAAITFYLPVPLALHLFCLYLHHLHTAETPFFNLATCLTIIVNLMYQVNNHLENSCANIKDKDNIKYKLVGVVGLPDVGATARNLRLHKTKLPSFRAAPQPCVSSKEAPPLPNSHLNLQAITCLSLATRARSSECLSPVCRWHRDDGDVSIRGSAEHGGFLLCRCEPLITAG